LQKLIPRHHGAGVIAVKEILCEQSVRGCHIMTGSGRLPAFVLDGADRLLVKRSGIRRTFLLGRAAAGTHQCRNKDQ
jgi:hypothetical protein